MATKLLPVATFILLYVATVFATCKKPRDCTQNNYAFELSAKVYPDLDSIRVGDTTWIEIDEPVTLQDVFTSASINYSGAINLGAIIGFQEIIGSTPQIVSVANDFNFKLINGTEVGSSDTQLFREYQFAEKSNRFLFRLGIIPRRAGIFRFNLGSAANVYRANDQCSKASFSFNIKNSNQHFYLYPNGGGATSGGGTYYFKVK